MTEIEMTDPNLRLALLDEVYRDRLQTYDWLSSLADGYTAHQARVGGPTWAQVAAGLNIDDQPEFEEYVRGLPLTAADLADLDALTLDGDREVYCLTPHWWDGDEPAYAITNLDGLRYCPELTDLDLGQGMHDGCHLGPLEALPKLERLSMCALDSHRDLEVLTRLPALTEVEVVNVNSADDRDAWVAVLTTLKERGVTIVLDFEPW